MSAYSMATLIVIVVASVSSMLGGRAAEYISYIDDRFGYFITIRPQDATFSPTAAKFCNELWHADGSGADLAQLPCAAPDCRCNVCHDR